jgi:uncharacterized protein Yka (UPF0111/DUF47 family)
MGAAGCTTRTGEIAVTEEQYQRAAAVRQQIKNLESAMAAMNHEKKAEIPAFSTAVRLLEDHADVIPVRFIEELLEKSRAHVEKTLNKAKREFRRL